MSLEAAIQENTAALRELIARFEYGIPLVTAENPTSSKPARGTSAKQAEKAAAEAKEVSATPSPTPAPAETASTASIDYQTEVKPKLVKLAATKGREAVASVLGKFGVAKGDQLPADKLDAVISEINEAMAA